MSGTPGTTYIGDRLSHGGRRGSTGRAEIAPVSLRKTPVTGEDVSGGPIEACDRADSRGGCPVTSWAVDHWGSDRRLAVRDTAEAIRTLAELSPGDLGVVRGRGALAALGSESVDLE